MCSPRPACGERLRASGARASPRLQPRRVGKANGSRKRAPDDRLRVPINLATPPKPGGVSDSEGPDPDEVHNVAPMQDVFAASGTVPLAEASRHGLGHLTRVYGSGPVTARDGADELVRQQRIVMGSSRFGIPALVHEECLTGFTAYGATVYPAADRVGCDLGPGAGRAHGHGDRPRHGARSACTRDSRPSSTSYVTIGGDGSRKPSARIPTSSRIAGHRLRAGPPVAAA